MSGPAEPVTAPAVETVWRLESTRLLGGLLRLVHDLDTAEDLAQEALLTALERWPVIGIPDNPGAWLMTVARNRAIDQLRRARMTERTTPELTARAEPPGIGLELEPPLPDPGDDVLRLILVACHPVLSAEARAALTLKLIAGLSTAEIARAFLVSEPTAAQRIVRAKRTLAAARVPFEVPRGAALAARLPSVLEILYLLFNEGYTASSGEHWLRPALCDEALRLARRLAALAPSHAEVLGLLALLELTDSRRRARLAPDGAPVLLGEQDRSRWDRLQIQRGLAALERAERLAAPLGPYTLQAEIAACHARASSTTTTDWPRIVALYDALVELTGSPVVELNRAVAVSMAFGPEQALQLVDALAAEPALARYHLVPAVRADLLARLGRAALARAELLRAAELTSNQRERAVLLARAQRLARPPA